MPQMAPYNWLNLYIMFNFLMMYMMANIYFLHCKKNERILTNYEDYVMLLKTYSWKW